MRRILTSFFTLFLLFFPLFFFATSDVYAQRRTTTVASPTPSPTPMPAIEVPYEEINPTDGTQYWIKRVKEKVGNFFAFSDSGKIDFLEGLVKTRLAELKYVIDNKEMGYFEKSTQRYFTVAGELTDFIVSKKNKEGAEKVRATLSSHIPVLTKLRDTYNPTTAEWRFVEDDINYIKGNIEKLSSF